MPVYMMSGAIEQLQDRNRLEHIGVAGFLRKPFDVESLIERLDELLLDPCNARDNGAPVELGTRV